MGVKVFKRDPKIWSKSESEKAALKKQKLRTGKYKFNNSRRVKPTTVYDLKLHLGNKTIIVETDNIPLTERRYKRKCKDEKIKYTRGSVYIKKPRTSSLF